MDDYLGMVLGNKYRRQQIKQTLLHTLDKVFWPLEKGYNPHSQEPASIKKFLKGNWLSSIQSKVPLSSLWTMLHSCMLSQHPFHQRWKSLLGKNGKKTLVSFVPYQLQSLGLEDFSLYFKRHFDILNKVIHISDWQKGFMVSFTILGGLLMTWRLNQHKWPNLPPWSIIPCCLWCCRS